MTDARPGTRMAVVDWSGRRMLATRGRAGLGPESWGLLRRLALREGLGGLATRWDGSRLLASGIGEALAGWSAGARDRPWDFLADAPEGEVLALWAPAVEDEGALSFGRRGTRPALFPARTGAPRMALRPVRPRRIAGTTAAEQAVTGPSSSRLARHAATPDRGGPGLPAGPAAAGASGGPLQAVPGRRITEVGADLAEDLLGFVRLRSRVPMGTASTRQAAGGVREPESVPTTLRVGGHQRGRFAAPGGLLRTVDLARAGEIRFAAGGGPEWPEVGATAWSAGPVETMAPRPFVPVSAGVPSGGFRGSGGELGLASGPGLHDRPGYVSGGARRGAFAPGGPFEERLPAGLHASDLALESPGAALLSFPRRHTGESEAPAVFPERVEPGREVVPSQSRTTRSGRGSRPVAARKAESRRATPEGFVARATFTPRRAGVEAPWFARPAQPVPVFGRSLWSASMGPAWPGEPAAVGARWQADSMIAPDAAMIGVPPLVALRPGAATFESRRPRDLRVAASADQEERGLTGWAGSPLVALGANLARMAAASGRAGWPRATWVPDFASAAEGAMHVGPGWPDLPDRTVLGLPGAPGPDRAGERDAGPVRTGAARVFPERSVARSPARDTESGEVRIASFAPRRAGVVAGSGLLPEEIAADDVLVALGMKTGPAGGMPGMPGSLVVPPWTGLTAEGRRIAVPESGTARLEGGFVPWTFLGTEERAFLAFPGATAVRGAAAETALVRTPGLRPSFTRWGRSRPGGVRPSTGARVHRVPAMPAAVTAGPMLPGVAEPGRYGTTPLARLMALGTGGAWTARGRTETAGLQGAAEAGEWMLDGLVRLGIRGGGVPSAVSRIPGAPGAGVMLRPGSATSGTPGLREPVVRTDTSAAGLRGPLLFAATRSREETLSTRTLASREVLGPGTAPAASRPAAGGVGVARAEGTTPWGFAWDVDEVFLRLPWADRLEDVDRAMAWTVTRPAEAVGRPGWRGFVAETPRGGVAGSQSVFPARHPAKRPGAAWPAVTARGEAATSSFRGLRDLLSAADERAGETPLLRLMAGEAVSGPGASPYGRTGWGGPATVAGDVAPLLVMARPPERGAEGREAAGWPGSRGGTGAIPAGAMWFIQRTLGRALRGLPPEAWGEAGPRAVESGLVPPDLAALLGIVPAKTRQARAETAGAGRRPERADGAVGDLVFPPGIGATAGEPRSVRPERFEARTPGLPEEPVTLEMSLGEPGTAGPVVGPGTVPSLSGLIRAGETPGPALRGLPLVAPAVSAVASQAMMSRRGEGPAARPTRTPDAQAPAAGSQAAGSQPIDLDVLAMEMAERILRRMKRDKERRGHHD